MENLGNCSINCGSRRLQPAKCTRPMLCFGCPEVAATNILQDIETVSKEVPHSGRKKTIYEESLALKLHNFYTGCERIFQKIADDINGGISQSKDWHKRLLKSMALEIENIRPSVISKETLKMLEEYLAFRHVIRNIYGFEIDNERLKRLVEKTGKVYEKLNKEFELFISFLKKMLEDSYLQYIYHS